MIRTGDTIHNPVTGERITFLATSRDTDGEAVVIETVVEPHGFARLWGLVKEKMRLWPYPY